MPTAPRFRAAWIAASQPSRVQGPAVQYGPWREHSGQAAMDAKTEVEAGRAAFAVVVEDAAGTLTPLAHTVYPAAARKAVRHYESFAYKLALAYKLDFLPTN